MANEKRDYRPKYLKKQKKAGKGDMLQGVAILVTAVVCVVLSVTMMGTVAQGAASAAGSGASTARDLALMDRFDMKMTNSVAQALDGVVAIERVYWLSDDDLIAPEPNPQCAGQTNDPTSLGWLLEKAEKTLGVTDTLFSTDVELMAGTEVHYYLDQTIMVISWKEEIHGAAYTFSEVKIAHPSQFRRFLADGTYGSAKQYLTTEMAATVNAVTASSGDFYKFRSNGVMVYNGTVYRNDSTVDTCYITEEGNMIFSRAGEISTKAQAEEFVAENNVRFSLAFGPILVENGQICTMDVNKRYPIGEGTTRYSRAGLGQLGELHYLMVAANLIPNAEKGTPTMAMFAEQMHSFGCQSAYALDGGQTAAIVTNDKLINRPDWGYQRLISDIIYFATAMPEED